MTYIDCFRKKLPVALWFLKPAGDENSDLQISHSYFSFLLCFVTICEVTSEADEKKWLQSVHLDGRLCFDFICSVRSLRELNALSSQIKHWNFAWVSIICLFNFNNDPKWTRLKPWQQGWFLWNDLKCLSNWDFHPYLFSHDRQPATLVPLEI